MILIGTDQECSEAIAQVDAELGYPRGYTLADLGVLVWRRGKGPWADISSIRTETSASVGPVDYDAEGNPTSARRIVRFSLTDEAPRLIVARHRVLRLLNRGSKEALMAVPGIGGTRADAIIARRAQGRMVSIEDLRAALPAATVKALRDYALTKVGDDDADETGVAAKAVQK